MNDEQFKEKALIGTTTNGNSIQNPMIEIADKAVKLLVKCQSEFKIPTSEAENHII